MRALLCAFVLLLVASPARAACDAPRTASGRVTLDVGGLSRSFIVRIPTGETQVPAPVVFAFHPFGMNAQYMQARAPISRAWPEAVVVYPEGSGLPPSWQNRPGERGDRDLHFFDAMLAWLRDHACIDPARVFVMGYSNGAALAYTIACERAGVIAGLAIVSGRAGCTPASPEPVIIRHGTHDRTIAYAEAIAASQKFSTGNGCKAPPKNGVPGCVDASGCGRAPVVLCTDDGGHEYNPAFTAEAVRFMRAMK